ncbi:MAG: bifunctional riboflavin kinase/FAD synthetase [Dehalococcoidia bacterium]|nr:bifunctional riboflavin kinase/FAD synthetase [Dehalococcoidia bacterium]
MDINFEKELKSIAPEKNSVLSIGVFNGVHLGHCHLIGRLVTTAREHSFSSIVITFKEKPRNKPGFETRNSYITSLPDRIQLIKDLGVDIVAAMEFTPEITGMGAAEFVILLQKHLKIKGMVVGPNFALGRNREGDIKTLTALGKEMGFFIEVVPPAMLNGEIVSSTAIRKALALGDISRAGALLGRRFSVKGLVVTGKGRGRTLGFPTANLAIEPEYVLPKDGVYTTRSHFDCKEYSSVTNIGFSPTFDGGIRTIEVFIMDFSGDLYNKEIKIEIIERLRDEIKFPSVEELRRQMTGDVERARELLSH